MKGKVITVACHAYYLRAMIDCYEAFTSTSQPFLAKAIISFHSSRHPSDKRLTFRRLCSVPMRVSLASRWQLGVATAQAVHWIIYWMPEVSVNLLLDDWKSSLEIEMQLLIWDFDPQYFIRYAELSGAVLLELSISKRISRQRSTSVLILMQQFYW